MGDGEGFTNEVWPPVTEGVINKVWVPVASDVIWVAVAVTTTAVVLLCNVPNIVCTLVNTLWILPDMVWVLSVPDKVWIRERVFIVGDKDWKVLMDIVFSGVPRKVDVRHLLCSLQGGDFFTSSSLSLCLLTSLKSRSKRNLSVLSVGLK